MQGVLKVQSRARWHDKWSDRFLLLWLRAWDLLIKDNTTHKTRAQNTKQKTEKRTRAQTHSHEKYPHARVHARVCVHTAKHSRNEYRAVQYINYMYMNNQVRYKEQIDIRPRKYAPTV